MGTPEKEARVAVFSKRKTLAYSLLPALLLLGGGEGCARLYEYWRPPLTLDYGWGFNEDSRVFVPAGIARNTMVTRPEKQVSFMPQYFAMPKPDNVYRIVALGGSNVNYMHWQLMLMAKRLSNTPGETRQFEVINMGGLAYGSHRLRIMTAEILGYEPDLVMIYAGHNEFQEMQHQALVALERVPIQKVAYSFAMLRLLRDVRASIDLARRTAAIVAQRGALPPEIDWVHNDRQFTDADVGEQMRLFRENLSAIASTCGENGVPVVISTVATNLWVPRLSPEHAAAGEEIRRLYAQGAYEAGMALARETLAGSVRHQACDTENGIIREVAVTFGLPLVEGARIIEDAEPNGVPGETLLKDECHLTARGIGMVLAAFEARIREIAGVPVDHGAVTPR